MAFFYLCLIISHEPAFAQQACESTEFDSTVSVQHVIDGDTIITANNTHIRLLGIDTPEIDHETGNHDPGATDARSFLTNQLKETTQIGLVFDDQRKDQYGRTLAHVFLVDGRNLQAELLKAGHAVPYTFPPNLRYIDCYYAMAQSARSSGLGMWKSPHLQQISATELKPSDRNFRIITGKITDIFKSKRSLIIELNQTLRVFILNSNLHYFENMELDSKLGKTIRVYGKIDYRDNVFWVQLRHPNDLKTDP